MHWLLFLLRFFLNRLGCDDRKSIRLAVRVDGRLFQVRRPFDFWENPGSNVRWMYSAVWRWLGGSSSEDPPVTIDPTKQARGPQRDRS